MFLALGLNSERWIYGHYNTREKETAPKNNPPALLRVVKPDVTLRKQPCSFA